MHNLPLKEVIKWLGTTIAILSRRPRERSPARPYRCRRTTYLTDTGADVSLGRKTA
nr:MAG TPA: hypothetical protein [Caudoviricetes sp.]